MAECARYRRHRLPVFPGAKLRVSEHGPIPMRARSTHRCRKGFTYSGAPPNPGAPPDFAFREDRGSFLLLSKFLFCFYGDFGDSNGGVFRYKSCNPIDGPGLIFVDPRAYRGRQNR